MSEEKNIPLATQQAVTYELISRLQHIRARLQQKIDMEKSTPDGHDPGDIYYHDGLLTVEQVASQVLNLQCWIKENIQTQSTIANGKDSPIKNPSAKSPDNKGFSPEDMLQTPVFSLKIWHLVLACLLLLTLVLYMLGALPPVISLMGQHKTI